MVHVNYWAVLVSAIVVFVLGWLWYSPLLFYKPWMRARGLDPAAGDGRRKNAGGETGHRAGAVPRPRLHHRSLRRATRRYQLAGRGTLRGFAVDRFPCSAAHWIHPLGEYSGEGGRDSRR